jgi:tRNA(Ser,Leu) C12 N-acetylase TAN1
VESQPPIEQELAAESRGAPLRVRLAYFKGLKHWNILATAKEGRDRRLSALLRRYREFRRTRFRGVFVGRVKDPSAFLEDLLRREREHPGFLDSVSKIVPVERTFEFSVETFGDCLKEAMLPYAEVIDGGSFYVRIERRGHIGEIHSQHIEQDIDRMLLEHVTARGQTPTVNFRDPDVILVAETLDDECGVAALPRSLRERFPFIRVR